MKFLDEAKIYLKAGDGGNGACSFRREKFIEFGGPNGGNGGAGADIVFVAVKNLNTLIDFRYQQHFKAQKGENGSGSSCTGASAEDMIIKVPVGTEIVTGDGKTILADLLHEGDRYVAVHGGSGGRGNESYKSSTNQAPYRADAGTPGEEAWVWLRLKLIADLGLIGLPNAGKSTFLSSVTRAKPKIADYPFTTLYPNLGVAEIDGKEILLADIPGLIEGASQGQGLGTRFLKHVERCSCLIHLIDATGEDPAAAYRTIRRELIQYSHLLAEKPELVALSKIDALPPDILEKQKQKLQKVLDGPIFAVSAVAHIGVKDLLRAAEQFIQKKDDENEGINKEEKAD